MALYPRFDGSSVAEYFGLICMFCHLLDSDNANGAADKLREGGTLACRPDRQLQPLDGRRVAPGRKWMVIRSADGAARSVRAIVVGYQLRPQP